MDSVTHLNRATQTKGMVTLRGAAGTATLERWVAPSSIMITGSVGDANGGGGGGGAEGGAGRNINSSTLSTSTSTTASINTNLNPTTDPNSNLATRTSTSISTKNTSTSTSTSNNSRGASAVAAAVKDAALVYFTAFVLTNPNRREIAVTLTHAAVQHNTPLAVNLGSVSLTLPNAPTPNPPVPASDDVVKDRGGPTGFGFGGGCEFYDY
jgi:hypothetical protein